MSDILIQRDIGHLIRPVNSVRPQSSGAATINGGSVDRFLHNLPLSAVMRTALGAVSGAPTSFTVQSTLQHAPDNATWTNYAPLGTTVQGAVLAAANADDLVAVNLSSAQRYLRVQTVITFVGGTSPAVLVMSDLIVSGEQEIDAI